MTQVFNKASSSDATAGTNDSRYMTPLMSATQILAMLPVKTTSADVLAGTDDSKYVTSLPLKTHYYNKTEIDAFLAGVSPVGHTHDDRYFTEAEITALLTNYVPYSGASGHVNLGTQQLSAGSVHVGTASNGVLSSGTNGALRIGGTAASYIQSYSGQLLAGEDSSGFYFAVGFTSPSKIIYIGQPLATGTFVEGRNVFIRSHGGPAGDIHIDSDNLVYMRDTSSGSVNWLLSNTGATYSKSDVWHWSYGDTYRWRYNTGGSTQFNDAADLVGLSRGCGFYSDGTIRWGANAISGNARGTLSWDTNKSTINSPVELELQSPTVDVQGTLTVNFGVTINAPNAGANNWALYSPATANSYFAGNVGIGTAYPGATLEVNGSMKSGLITFAGDPTTLDLASGLVADYKNSGSGAVKRWVNDGGTMKSLTYT